MNTEFSRQRFNSWNDFSSVLQQQGRVLLDAEWNELNEIIDRRWRAETIDIIGRGVVPKQTPAGFKPVYDPSTKQLTIGPGRLYVDGLLAENHGKAAAGKPLDFDPALAELHGTTPIGYSEQPYYPNPAALPTGPGPHLIYVDVWAREVTNLERPDLVEPAVGIDTTTRLQTAWQVRVLSNTQGANLSCSTPDDQIAGWLDIITPSAGRLTTAAMGVPSSDDPCQVPLTGGYRSLENRCYRVEIHSVDPKTGAAAFKWARDNRSMAAAIQSVPAPNQIVVDRVQLDAILRFNAGDWVEITDDWRELAGLPGIIAKIAAQVDDSSRSLTLSLNLSTTDFPLDAQNQPDPARHMRIRKWDQSGIVRDSSGNVVKDLNADNTGLIPVQTDPISILLEDGVQITFSLDALPAGPSRFRVGDYWVFAARAADASVEILTKAPPRGVHHHYCRLGFLTSTGANDCRQLWPPDCGGASCACTVCVTAESHADGSLTLQQAIDRTSATGGTVCVAPGNYLLQTPLRIAGARSIRVKGQGWQTILSYAPVATNQPVAGPAILVQDSQDFLLEDLAITVAGAPLSDQPVIGILNSKEIVIEHCLITVLLLERMQLSLHSAAANAASWLAVGLGGVLQNIRIRENYVFCPVGVANWGVAANPGLKAVSVIENTRLVTTGLQIENNTLECTVSAVRLQGASVHFGSSVVAANFILGCHQGAVIVTGVVDSNVYSASHFDLAQNTLRVFSDGIVIGVSDARIDGNDISSMATTFFKPNLAGIALVLGQSKAALERCQLLGNRVTRLPGHAISIRGQIGSAMIKQNIVENVLGNGIMMEPDSKAQWLTIENNQFITIGNGVGQVGTSNQLPVAAAIYLIQTDSAEVANNAIGLVGAEAVAATSFVFGILSVGCLKSKITSNRIVGIGPAESPLRIVAGILVGGSFENLEVAGNHIRRANVPFSQTKPDNSNWLAVMIAGAGAFTEARLGDLLLVRGVEAQFVLGKASAFAIPNLSEMAAVRGNLIEAYGTAAPVRVTVAGACVFSDNLCRHNPAGEQPVVEIGAAAIAMSSNFIENAGQDAAGAAALTAARLSTGAASFTVLGNVTRGVIIVNNAVLGPTVPLNAILA